MNHIYRGGGRSSQGPQTQPGCEGSGEFASPCEDIGAYEHHIQLHVLSRARPLSRARLRSLEIRSLPMWPTAHLKLSQLLLSAFSTNCMKQAEFLISPNAPSPSIFPRLLGPYEHEITRQLCLWVALKAEARHAASHGSKQSVRHN